MAKMSKRDASRDKARQQKAIKNNDLFRDEPRYPRKKLVVSLPIAPSMNHMYYQRRNGKKVLTASAQRYIMEATALIRLACEEQMWMVDNRDVWYYMDIMVYMPDRKIRDSHNMLKLMLVVFQDIAFRNDYFIMPRIQDVSLDKDNPRIEVALRPQSKSDRRKNWT